MTKEQGLRAAALKSIERFCEVEGFPVPQLVETRVVKFVGKAPDGREFALGYEVKL